eukprot:SAG11_NODE_770_length_7257_cov_2.448449_14_plen_47_part_00
MHKYSAKNATPRVGKLLQINYTGSWIGKTTRINGVNGDHYWFELVR